MHRLERLAAIALAGQMASAAEATPAVDAAPSPRATRFIPKDGAAPAPTATAGVRGLPHSQGQRFATLDAYLAFLRDGGTIDRPWYKEIAPGVYELQSTLVPAPPRRVFTRRQLERSFGFAR